MANEGDILTKVSNYVTRYIENNLPGSMYFHNLQHTTEVVKAVSEIGSNEGISEEALEPLLIAAWLHDTGYCVQYLGHESASVALAKRFLVHENYPNEKLNLVISCIEATRYPQMPTSEEAKIVCDADMYHFSCLGYDSREQALRKEWAVYLNLNFSDEEWARENCQMLINHQYFTDYGKNNLQIKKDINIAAMRCRFDKSQQ